MSDKIENCPIEARIIQQAAKAVAVNAKANGAPVAEAYQNALNMTPSQASLVVIKQCENQGIRNSPLEIQVVLQAANLLAEEEASAPKALEAFDSGIALTPREATKRVLKKWER